VEEDIYDYLAWRSGVISGALGYPTTSDWDKKVGRSTKRYYPSPPDFPRRLRIAEYIYNRMPHDLQEVILCCYLCQGDDVDRALVLNITPSGFCKRKKKAYKWINIADEMFRHKDFVKVFTMS